MADRAKSAEASPWQGLQTGLWEEEVIVRDFMDAIFRSAGSQAY